MKNLFFVLCLSVFAVIFSSCSGVNAADLFSGEIRFGLRQGSIAPRLAGDTVSIVRAFPSTTISVLPGRDSVYALRSGDRLAIMWKADGTGIMFCDIVADTVSFVRR